MTGRSFVRIAALIAHEQSGEAVALVEKQVGGEHCA